MIHWRYQWFAFEPTPDRCLSLCSFLSYHTITPQNYTDVGFKKIRAPEKVFKLIKEFWDKNKDKGKPENWGIGNTYTNNWISMTDMVSVEDTGLRGGGSALKQHIWDSARDTIQEWTGQELTQVCQFTNLVRVKTFLLHSPFFSYPAVFFVWNSRLS
jgi:hypothetical protein